MQELAGRMAELEEGDADGFKALWIEVQGKKSKKRKLAAGIKCQACDVTLAESLNPNSCMIRNACPTIANMYLMKEYVPQNELVCPSGQKVGAH